MKCIICESNSWECVHEGTRDVSELNVMRCTRCGFVQLDNFLYNTEINYAEGGMLADSYCSLNDKSENMSWETWISETSRDDDRRFEALKTVCEGKKVLEFGCGNGGFLRRIKNVAAEIVGIELMDEARMNIDKEGIKVVKSVEELEGKFDIVCMFHVIEHLNDPDTVIKSIHDILNENGTFICETCNVDCALQTYYECKAYEDFTFWSEHVILFNSDTLEKLINRNGFSTRLNTQLERYPLGNHLYWLAKGKPGGHVKWSEFNDDELNSVYEKKLINLGLADTLWYVGDKVAISD